MTPPAHLLPLALEAMTSADAWEVIGDALLESQWCDWRLRYVASSLPVPKEEAPGDCAESINVLCQHFHWDWQSRRLVMSAIAAILLFGDWVWGERWPLVEANEALSSGPFLAHIERLKGMLDDNVITVDQFRELLNMPMRAAGVRE